MAVTTWKNEGEVGCQGDLVVQTLPVGSFLTPVGTRSS